MSSDQKKNKLIQSILDSFPPKDDLPSGLFLSFAQALLSHVRQQDLEGAPPERWALVVESWWQQAYHLPTSDLQIIISTPTLPFHKGEGKRTVIQLINTDRPFLLDSTLAELGRHHLFPSFILHPVLGIKRDGKGHITHLKKTAQASYKGPYESLIHIELIETLNPEKREALKLSLSRVMKNVAQAVQDWPPMREKLKSLFQPSFPLSPEEKEFLLWLDQNHWTFLGYRQYAIKKGEALSVKTLSLTHALGIFREEALPQAPLYGSALQPHFLEEKSAHKIGYSKVTTESLVHKSELLDMIEIPQLNDKGGAIFLHQFFGLFTSAAYRASAWQVPLLRGKVSSIFNKSGLLSEWHDGKKWVRFLDDFPRDELLSLPEDRLFSFSTGILEAQEHHASKILLRLDPFQQFLSCIIYLPQEDYSSELLERAVASCETEVGGKVTSCHMRLGDSPYAWIHLIISRPVHNFTESRLRPLEQKILQALETWHQSLQKEVLAHWGDEEGQSVWALYDRVFDQSYQKRFSPSHARDDIIAIQNLVSPGAAHQVSFQLEPQENSQKLKLRVFSLNQPVPLSTLLPILENLGVQVVSEHPFSIKINDSQTWVSIQDMEMVYPSEQPLNFSSIQKPFLDCLRAVWLGRVENDGFNKLVLSAELTYEECQVLRAYGKYQRQMGMPFSVEYIQQTILKNPSIVKLLIQLFHGRFNPLKAKTSKTLLASIKKALKGTTSTDEDRILGLYLKLIMVTVRTNYYQKTPQGEAKDYLSFKLDARKIDDLPLPRPLYEIYVYSASMEAVHLRGDMVARGGIRWSDRKEDFRTEILGLLKAQMTKNAVIVPGGSKGGFILKGGEETRAQAIEAYKTMMCGMLDLTDNIQGGKISPPPHVYPYDGDDSYLVVAADKGTATFSDIANEISLAYGFWLGDAFASGGSSGYDHKKMAITARGAWESVKRHFRYLGDDIDQNSFQVIGIGDMSGDVFGNGMLLSDKIKLVGAFNHLHIFIDPTPDPALSLAERQRLFDLPTSTWMDYNPQALSPGGRVFSRREKTLKLTKEIKYLLGIHRDEVTPNDLMRHLLLFPADLLWLGGIGTFVKSGKETHLDAGDRANDYLRVDGQHLRCRVLVEGANLGVTQQGRVEYALKGGRINTDFVDNSGGVDCSDHEVNIKILLNQMVTQGSLSLPERNKLLSQMGEEVTRLVLQDNYLQTFALQMAEFQSEELMEDHLRLMEGIETSGHLLRSLEYLPENEVVRAGRSMGRGTKTYGLTAPELAMVMAYVKNELRDRILNEVTLEAFFDKDFVTYFPQQIQWKFPREVKTHPLKTQITATVITNLMVNRLGLTFIQDVQDQRPDAKLEQIIQSFMVVRHVFQLDEIWQQIDQLDRKVDMKTQTRLMIDLSGFVRQACVDALLYPSLIEEGLREIVIGERPEEGLGSQIVSLLGEGKNRISGEYARLFLKKGVPEPLLQHLSLLKVFTHPFQIVYLAKNYKSAPSTVVLTYFKIEEDFNLIWLRTQADTIPVHNLWQQQTVSQFMEALLQYQNRLCSCLLEDSSQSTLHSYQEAVKTFQLLLGSMKESASFDVTMLGVAVTRLGKLAQAITQDETKE